MSRLAFAASTVLIALSIPQVSQASILPAASVFGNLEAVGIGPPGNSCCEGPHPSFFSAGTRSVSYSDFYGSTTTASSNSTLVPFPSLSMSLNAGATNSHDDDGAEGLLELDYYVAVNGPQGSLVSLNFTSTASATTNNNANAFESSQTFIDSYIVINGLQDLVYSLNGVTTTTTNLGTVVNNVDGSHTFNGSLNVYTNNPFKVTMFIQGTVSSSAGQDAGIGNAYVDPYFFIDPTFSNADLYSVITSEGVGNSLPSISPVPLPASAPMFGVAILVLGAFGYGMRRKQASAAD